MREYFYYKLLMLPGVGPKMIYRLLRSMDQKGFTSEEFLCLKGSELISSFGFSDSMVQSFFQENPDIEEDLNFTRAEEIRITALPEDDYPERLRKVEDCSAPVFLYHGDLTILSRFSVAFSGSRNPAPSSLEAVIDCVEVCSRNGVNVVSGYCRGVDITAHSTALSTGGTTTVVMPQGIDYFRIGSLGIDGLDADVLENLLIVSQFPIRYPWTAEGAFARNKTVCALSDVVILVEPKLKSGGTFHTGREALKMGKPLFVLLDSRNETDSEGERYFVKKGAIPMRRNKRGELPIENILKKFVNKEYHNI